MEMTHTNSVWFEDNVATFVVDVTLANTTTEVVERLWYRKHSESLFELCSIPFYAYNLALGDVVNITPDGPERFFISGIAQPSGHSTLRVWFGSDSNIGVQQHIIHDLVRLGCFLEWSNRALLAVDCVSESQVQHVATFLEAQQQKHGIQWEMAHRSYSNGDGIHFHPVHGAQADTFVYVPITEKDCPFPFEQLWARTIDESTYELCCVPLFIDNMALGDYVTALPSPAFALHVAHVIQPSGHVTIRVLFEDNLDEPRILSIMEELRSLGCQIEGYGPKTCGLDCPSLEQAARVEDYLWEKEKAGDLNFETGYGREPENQPSQTIT